MALFAPSPNRPPRRHAVATACVLSLLGSAAAWAQATTTDVVNITGHAVNPPASVAGFGDVPLANAPFQAATLSAARLADAGVETLGEVTRLDASVGDAYNAPGYWASLRVRGYALDNRSNYRRDGLPVSGETALLLDNKERVELLKGTSGAQAGVSAPGGLVNLVVKRSRADNTTLRIGLSDAGSLSLAADIDRRLGADGGSGLRINLAGEAMNPMQHSARGQRMLAAVAGDTRLGHDDLLEAEAELSHQSQPSVPGFSLLGNTLPSARNIDPRINLNNQPWSLPVVFDGGTASLRWTHAINAEWRTVAQAMTQQLRTDDRIAFPFGCSAENAYDRYCSDGSFDLYDYRSEGERRNTHVLALRLEGQFDTGAVAHQVSAGLLSSRFSARFQRQAYNWAGIGTIDGRSVTPAAPDLAYDNTNRDEQSTELQLFDRMHLGRAGLWLGLRHTRLQRESALTDGSANPSYAQSFSTPWLALSWQLSPVDMVYASSGQGIESYVTPNLPSYGSAKGQALPPQRSHQTEIGVKHDGQALGWSLAAFDIRRPQPDDQGSSYLINGAARHQGVEAAAEGREGPWSLQASAMWLRARMEGGSNAAANGLVPPNVAQRTARAQLGYQPASLPGLALYALLSYEGPRFVLPDDSLRVGGWSTAGLAVRQSLRAAGHDWTLRAGVDNLFDRRAWQESPYQYGHVYLYPLAPRTFRASLQVSL